MSLRSHAHQRGRKILKELKTGRTSNLAPLGAILLHDEDLYEEAWPILLNLLQTSPAPTPDVDTVISPQSVAILCCIWSGMSGMRNASLVSRMYPQFLDSFPTFIPWLELAVIQAVGGNVHLPESYGHSRLAWQDTPIATQLFILCAYLLIILPDLQTRLPYHDRGYSDLGGRMVVQSEWYTVPNYIYYSSIFWFLSIKMKTNPPPKDLPGGIHDLFGVFVQGLSSGKPDQGKQLLAATSRIEGSNMICLKALSFGLSVNRKHTPPAFLFQALLVMKTMVEHGIKYKAQWEAEIAITTICSAFDRHCRNDICTDKDKQPIFPVALGVCSRILNLLLSHPSHWKTAISHGLFASCLMSIAFANKSPDLSAPLVDFLDLLHRLQTSIQVEQIAKHVSESFVNKLKKMDTSKLPLPPTTSPELRKELEEKKTRLNKFILVIQFSHRISTAYAIANRKLCANVKCPTGGATKKAFKICGGCYSVFYCSRECQKKDWKKRHKLKCRNHGYRGPPINNRDMDYFKFQTDIKMNPFYMRELFGERWPEYAKAVA